MAAIAFIGAVEQHVGLIGKPHVGLIGKQHVGLIGVIVIMHIAFIGCIQFVEQVEHTFITSLM